MVPQISVSWLLVQQLLKVNNKEKGRHYRSFCGESTGDRRIPCTKGHYCDHKVCQKQQDIMCYSAPQGIWKRFVLCCVILCLQTERFCRNIRGENCTKLRSYMLMTSWYGNAYCTTGPFHDGVIKWKYFRVTGHLCGEFTGHRWIHRTKASDTELWCFIWSAPEWRLSKQSWGWWFETPPRPLWRQSNVAREPTVHQYSLDIFLCS